MFAMAAWAQGGSLTLTTGYHHIARQDLVFSPMVQRGSAFPNVGLAYTYVGERMRHAVRLNYDGYDAGITEPYDFVDLVDGSAETTSRSNYTLVDLSYELLVPLPDSGATIVRVGGGVYGQLGSLNQGYAYPSFGYTLFFGLGPAVRVEHTLDERTTLHGGFSIPLVGWVARSPYALNDDEFIEDQRSHRTLPTLAAFIGGGRVASFGSFRRALLELGAERRLSTHWSLGLRYGLEYLDISKPVRLISFRNSVDAAFTYHFGRR